jgi:hypothetical protein
LRPALANVAVNQFFDLRRQFPFLDLQFASASIQQHLITSIKEEVKKKHFSLGWKFSCFSAHTIERELF